jgi:hypothetical protein
MEAIGENRAGPQQDREDSDDENFARPSHFS